MAKADRSSMGAGAQGKGTGTGAMTELPEGVLEENMVLSNRDKSRHTDERGLDGRNVQTEQYHDHAGNRQMDAEADEGNTSGLGTPMMQSGEDSSLKSKDRG
ncbi:hypothetical protein [Methylobacterium sp. A54F]